MRKHIHLLLSVVCCMPVLHAQAQSMADHSAHHPAQVSVPTAVPMTDGEVRKIDKEQGKITIKHGSIVHLDMPGMTMIFKVADRGLLDNVQSGAKIKFAVENVHGALTVTEIHVLK